MKQTPKNNGKWQVRKDQGKSTFTGRCKKCDARFSKDTEDKAMQAVNFHYGRKHEGIMSNNQKAAANGGKARIISAVAVGEAISPPVTEALVVRTPERKRISTRGISNIRSAARMRWARAKGSTWEEDTTGDIPMVIEGCPCCLTPLKGVNAQIYYARRQQGKV